MSFSTGYCVIVKRLGLGLGLASKQEANNHYQKNVKNKIPCEMFEDGQLQKEYKPN